MTGGRWMRERFNPQGPEGREPNVSPARKGWDRGTDSQNRPSAGGASLNVSYMISCLTPSDADEPFLLQQLRPRGFQHQRSKRPDPTGIRNATLFVYCLYRA